MPTPEQVAALQELQSRRANLSPERVAALDELSSRWSIRSEPELPKEKPGYASEAYGGLKRAVSSLVGLPRALLTPHDTYGATAEEEKKLGPLGRLIYNIPADTAQFMENAEVGRRKAARTGEGFAGQALGYLENFGPLGTIVKKAEEAGPGYAKLSPQTVGAVTEGATLAAAPLLPKAVKEVAPAVGRTIRAAAEGAAESSLGVTNKGRSFGKTPGASVLAETEGLKPETVLDSARQRLSSLGANLESSYRAAGANGGTASVQPALDILDAEIAKARTGQNPGLVDALISKRARLTHDLTNINAQGQPQPFGPDIPPERLWKIKQNWGDDTNWNANVDPRIRGKIDRQVYRAMDSELDRVAPGTDALNQRYSSLKSVAQRADITSRGESLPQAVWDRIARRTGGAAVGMYGLTHGEPLAGAAALVLPEVLSRPTPKMAIARGLYKLGGGAKLQP